MRDWSQPLTVWIPGEPEPKARPRKERGRWRTPARAWGKACQDAVRELGFGPGREWAGAGQVAVCCRFYGGERADLDNLVKETWDALNRYLWVDDQQVRRSAESVEPVGVDGPGCLLRAWRIEG